MNEALKVDPHDTLYVTDAEMIRRMGVPEKVARPAIAMLDKNPRSGFPKKLALWGGRRHWPSVQRYLERTSGGEAINSQEQRKRA